MRAQRPYENTDKMDKRTAEDRAIQEGLLQRGALPVHIAVIMDGNGRWAKSRGRSRVFGHQHGVESVRDVTEACAELGVRHLTLYTFSTENWFRPALEVNALMELLVRTIRRETRTLLDNDIRLDAIGDLSRLPGGCRQELKESIEMTASCSRMTLSLALSYSGRWEIVRAAREFARRVADAGVDPESLDEDAFAELLKAGKRPDPDLLIRTGGEMRISNFLLWQLAYTELYFSEVQWPDFRRIHVYEAIRVFQDRERRFGRVLENATQ